MPTQSELDQAIAENSPSIAAAIAAQLVIDPEPEPTLKEFQELVAQVLKE